MLKTTINDRQLIVLKGIAYRIADIHFLKERYGDDAKHEIEVSRKTLTSLFAEADKENIPFFVQNTVLCFFENWRNYLNTDVVTYLINLNRYDIMIER